jgi:Fe-S cluster biogenesis protein NfuA
MNEVATFVRVRRTVDADIRPLLKLHGGDVTIVEVTDEGCVRLEFGGACRGCALQSVTYAVAIRQRLLEVAGVSEVTMKGVNVSAIALERIAQCYKGHRFRMREEREE